MKKILLIIMSFFVLNLNVLAEEDFAPNGKSAILVDNLSGKVLYEKNADEKLAPASMTKLASMLMVMEAIDNGNLKFEDKVTISEEAANMGGSQVFLQAGEVYTVYDLLKSVAIASGNDAVVALAEKIGGSQSGFIDMLNKRLKEIGATNTNFVNAHGLDAEGHYSTARDMSIIARELLKHRDRHDGPCDPFRGQLRPPHVLPFRKVEEVLPRFRDHLRDLFLPRPLRLLFRGLLAHQPS